MAVSNKLMNTIITSLIVFLIALGVFLFLYPIIKIHFLADRLNKAAFLKIEHSFVDWAVGRRKREELVIRDKTAMANVAELLNSCFYFLEPGSYGSAALLSADCMYIEIYRDEKKTGQLFIVAGNRVSFGKYGRCSASKPQLLNNIRKALGLRGVPPKDFSWDPNDVQKMREARAAENSLQEPNNTQ